MRCIVCGGEIDEETKRCEKCGECWGGGNYSVARTISARRQEDDYTAPGSRAVQPSFFSRLRDGLFSAYCAVDDTLAPAADRVVFAVRSRQKVLNRAERISPRRDRAVVYLSALLLIAVIIIAVVGISAGSKAPTLVGRWSLEGNEADSHVVMEFSSSKEIKMWIGDEGDRHLYRQGTYSVTDDLLSIDYNDGSHVLLRLELGSDNALFRDPATDKAQKYFKHHD